MNSITSSSTGLDIEAAIRIGGAECDKAYAEACAVLRDGLKSAGVPFVRASGGSLRRGTRFWAQVVVGLDLPEAWANGIFENSNYARLTLSADHEGKLVIEHLSGPLGFRKSRVKTLGDVVAKVGAKFGGAK